MFLSNDGQWPTDARFLARHRSFVARFHDDGIVLQRERGGASPLGVAVRMGFVGARTVAPMIAEPGSGRMHSFVGATAAWRRDLAYGAALRYAGLWPGIDLVVHDRQGELEYDFELAAGADLGLVALRCEGGEGASLQADGSLLIATVLGDLRQEPPETWEVGEGGERHHVPCRFELRADGSYGFTAERIDASRPLVVDPVLLWSSYFGATGNDYAYALDVDGSGRVVVVGETTSLFTFPSTLGVYQPTFGGGLSDGFVAMLDPSAGGAAQLVWCTFFGGAENDYVRSIDLGPSGEVAISGYTLSTDLPTTPSALQTSKNAGGDGFVAVLSADGASLLYSTYLGGSGNDHLNAIQVETDGRIFVAGYATAGGLPTSVGAFQSAFAGGVYDGYVARLDRTQAGAAQLAWGTYFGAVAEDVFYDLAVSPVLPGMVTCVGYCSVISPLTDGFRSGNTGNGSYDAMIVQFDPSLTGAAQKRMSHFTGGAGNDFGYSLGIEANGDLVVGGQTAGSYPVTPGSYRTIATNSTDGFLTKITANGASIRYATYLGSSSNGNGFSITPSNLHVATDGTVTIAGYTSWNIPLTSGAIDSGRAGFYESFVMRFDAPLTQLRYSTYLGGAGDDVMLWHGMHLAGDVATVACYTTSSGLSVQNPYQGGFRGGVYDGYLLRFDLVALPNGGAGTASYASATQPVGSGPRGLALVDVDLDGDQDILTANSGAHTLSLRRNDGAGGFGGTLETVALGAGNFGPAAVVGGDFDGDGVADDVMVACADSNTVVQVLGVASLVPILTSFASGGQRPVHLAAGDLDGDATTDVVVACAGSLLTGGAGLGVALDGAAPVALVIPLGRATGITRVALADLDGDGDRDVVAVAHGATDEIHLWSNDGLGVLTFAGFLPMTSTLSLGAGLCARDLDFDGDVDLVVAQPLLFPTVSQSIRVYRYSGSGALDASDYSLVPDIGSPGVVATALACADLDQDLVPGFGGGSDVVVVNGGSGTAEVYYGFSAATQAFGAFGTLTTGSGPVDVGVADLDGDTTIDIVIANQTANTVTIHRTDGALARPYGTGCAGLGGLVPRIAALGPPRLGLPFTAQVTLGRALAPALLGLSFGNLPTPLVGGCTLYLQDPFSTTLHFTDVSGQSVDVQVVPNQPALLGLDGFFQWAVFDDQGQYLNIASFSDALRVQVGR